MADVKEKGKGLLAEFKEFALKGNVMDMAVGVIIGAAFQNIVTALTDSLINPLIGLCMGGATKDENGNFVFDMGTFGKIGPFDISGFVSAVINFLIIALILFIMLKAVNKAMSIGKKKEEEKPKEPPKEEVLLTEIRDQLKALNEKK